MENINKKNKILTKIIIFFVAIILVSTITGINNDIYAKTKTDKDKYICKAHALLGKSYCEWATLTADGNNSTGVVYDVYFSSTHTHWPNNIDTGSTWSYTVGTTGYAKGTYKKYSSIVTEWASGALKSSTYTLKVTF